VFREPKLPKTRNKLIVGAITMVNRDITPIDAPNPCTRINQPAIATSAPTRGVNSVPIAAK
jgi:hypothetical protein